ncbi:MAG TPA: Cys-tRNA(Pro) deacylase [Clostridia bacterium]|nr:Cys-tRNA(Pro) deacylase [Clostridia bacterium]
MLVIEAKTNAVRMVEEAQVAHQLHTYEADGPVDGPRVAAMIGLPEEQVYKTLVAQGKSNAYHVFVLPVCCELDMKKAARAAGEKAVELIPVKSLQSVTGYVRGGCSPIGMKRRLDIYLEEQAQLLETVTVSAGRIGLQLTLAPDDLCALSGARYADLV